MPTTDDVEKAEEQRRAQGASGERCLVVGIVLVFVIGIVLFLILR